MGNFDWSAVRPLGTAVRWLALVALCIAGDAARVAALSNPNQFCTGDPCVISSAREADPNITLDFGNRAVILQNVLTIGETPGGQIGTLTIKARSFVMNGNGQIRGFSSSMPGGGLSIEVTNNILINSTVGSGAIRLSGQDAGSLALIATAGPINVAGRLAVYGDGIIGSGGSLFISSGSTITVTGEIDMRGGLQGAGGDIDLSASGDIIVSGFVDLTGGDVGGGFLDVNGGGSFTFSAADLSGSGEAGDAGFIIVDVAGNVRFQGPIRARGADNGEDCGDGADVDVSALGDVFIQAEMDIRGRGTDCSGGSMSLDGASVFIQADLLMSGTGLQGGGGDLDSTVSNLFRLSGNLELDGGDSGGGALFVFSDKDIEILGGVYAIGRSAFAPGASGMDLIAGARLTVSGTIDASSGGATAPGTLLGLSGCEVITNPSAVVRALGNSGSITVTANDTLRLRGQMRAAPNGGIALHYGPGAAPPDTVGTSFSPAPTSTLEPTLLPCRVCLNNSDCADGNPCTDDVCDITQCLNPPMNNIPCEDGDECSVDDFCSEGICVSGPIGTCNDADQDGKPDSTDECTTLIWSDPPTSRPDQNPLRFVMNFKRLSADDGEQRFLLKGIFNVAPSQPLLIDPAANGIHLYGEDADGSFYDVSLPGGGGCGPDEGWTTLGLGFKKVWIYRNTTNSVPPACEPGSAHGVALVQIKDKRIRPKGGLQFKIKGKNGTLLHDPTDPLTYIQLTLGLAAQTTPGLSTAQAKAGQCGEARFTGNPIQNETKPYCRTKIKRGAVDGVTCKGL